MTTVTNSFFESDVLNYILSLNEVIHAKSVVDALEEKGSFIFNIENTVEIKEVLASKFGVDASLVDRIPMRWIKGDTAPHIDHGSHEFQNTYLVYITGSNGELVVGDSSFELTPNTGFTFNEGVNHYTSDTGAVPRLMLGPMSETCSVVGAAGIVYFSSEAVALTGSPVVGYGNSFTVGDFTPLLPENNHFSSVTSWRIASNSTGPSSQTTVYTNGDNLINDGVGGFYFMYPAVPCFLEGTTILAMKDGVEQYVPVETLCKGTMVKTYKHGYKAVEVVGTAKIMNPGDSSRNENRLFKCDTAAYPELASALFVTGGHSILVDALTPAQRDETVKSFGKVFKTDDKFRLTARIDNRSEPWGKEKQYSVWHFALENNEPSMNYGVYANGGLLVETCSLRYLKTRSNMALK
jgi:hypothetical protein